MLRFFKNFFAQPGLKYDRSPATHFVAGNGPIWRILGENVFSKCSHTACMLRFFKNFFAQPALKYDRSPRFLD
jgi:hypothetical protein